jgi:hypothetical protein
VPALIVITTGKPIVAGITGEWPPSIGSAVIS